VSSAAGVGKRPPKLAIVKPDFGASGGFERHLDKLIAELAKRGWDITVVGVDAQTRPDHLAGLPVTTEMLHHHDDFFLLMGLIDRVKQLDLSGYDIVMSTQPPTYLVDHPCKVALFFHHARQFYDLADLFSASGLASPTLHAQAINTIRTLESDHVGEVAHWVAGSRHVAQRLENFWSLPCDRISTYSAPPDSGPPEGKSPPPRNNRGPVVTVSRIEWPKRVELAIAAVHLTRSAAGLTIVGGGSRRGFTASLDADFGSDPTLAATISDADLWGNAGGATRHWTPSKYEPSGRVDWLTQASDAERDALYAAAAVVVCPSHQEDYGLTALEAMAWARPVIVCSDGGGLTEFVADEKNGLIVEPTPQAVAEAIDRLDQDPDFADRLGAAGRETVAEITWERATDVVDSCLTEALASVQSP